MIFLFFIDDLLILLYSTSLFLLIPGYEPIRFTIADSVSVSFVLSFNIVRT